MKKTRKTIKTIMFTSDFDIPEPPPPPAIFSDVEREIIMADIAYLKQKEIESGDWDKWKESQRTWRDDDSDIRPARRRRILTPGLLVYREDAPITPEIFFAATGSEPMQDDMDRVNCSQAGMSGHWSCGWCADDNLPRFMCSHNHATSRSHRR